MIKRKFREFIILNLFNEQLTLYVKIDTINTLFRLINNQDLQPLFTFYFYKNKICLQKI